MTDTPNPITEENIDCLHRDWRLKKIMNYDEKYLVSANGKVYSLARRHLYKKGTRPQKGKWMSPLRNINNGYLSIILYKGDRNTCTRLYVHRLVAEAYIPNPDNKPVVNHKDNNRQHNCVNNLEWCTTLENVHHMIATGNFRHGEKSGVAKLKKTQVLEIRQKLAKGEKQKDIAAGFNISRQTIGLIKNGKTWMRT